jgi:hypothetical protein
MFCLFQPQTKQKLTYRIQCECRVCVVCVYSFQ